MMKPLLFLCFALTARADILAVPHPSCTFDAAHTVIWTPLFQTAWDSLNAAHNASGKPTVEPPNKVIDWLDTFVWKADDVLPKDSWFVQAGPMNPELYLTANQTAQQRWGLEPFKFPESVTPGGFGALAVMMRQVAFETPFERSKESALKFEHGDTAKDVQYFGSINAEELAGVRVLHDHQAQGSFALQASCKDADDRVIFYMPEKSSTFAEACQAILKWKRRQGLTQEDGTTLQNILQKNEIIRIPYITFSNSANFLPLLQGTRTFPNQTTPFLIAKAEQKLYFQLDEKGATTIATVELYDIPFGYDLSPDPRVFNFDKPFFVFLWREKADWPYLGIWLGDTTAMHPMEP